MRILADTHVLLWWLADDKALGPKARTIITQTSNDVYCSSVSISEIWLKVRIGKLKIPEDFITALREQSFDTIMYDIKSAQGIQDLPDLAWKDPFDLMLLAQAVETDLSLMTADKNILNAKVKGLLTIDARE